LAKNGVDLLAFLEINQLKRTVEAPLWFHIYEIENFSSYIFLNSP
jgi:hypothetical protein